MNRTGELGPQSSPRHAGTPAHRRESPPTPSATTSNAGLGVEGNQCGGIFVDGGPIGVSVGVDRRETSGEVQRSQGTSRSPLEVEPGFVGLGEVHASFNVL